MNTADSKFIKKYKKDAIEAFKVMHPEWDEDEMDEILSGMIDESILTVVDWSFDRNPLIAGNGTFYKSQYEAINPIANMLLGFLTKRKQIKKEMFAVEDKTSRKYFDMDLQQNIEKINANSYYGASGMPSSPFYSLYSGPKLLWVLM